MRSFFREHVVLIEHAVEVLLSHEARVGNAMGNVRNINFSIPSIDDIGTIKHREVQRRIPREHSRQRESS